jgi:hypothetical protein
LLSWKDKYASHRLHRKQFIHVVFLIAKVGSVEIDDDEELVERLVFPVGISPLSREKEVRAFDETSPLNTIAGVGYYKAKLPPEIVVKSGSLSREQAEFGISSTLGLGEFFFETIWISGVCEADFTSPAPSFVRRGRIR